MRKTIIAALCALSMLFSCAFAEADVDRSAIAKAMEITGDMAEIAGMDNLTGLYSADEDLMSGIHEIAACDYSAPESAVVVTISDECVAGIIDMLEIDAPVGSGAFRAVKGKVYSVFPTMINGSEGASYLAMTSILSTSDVYTPQVPFDGIVYVLLKYAGDQSDVLCAFNMNGDSAVVTAFYISGTALDSIDWSLDAAAIIENLGGTEVGYDFSGVTIKQYPPEEF